MILAENHLLDKGQSHDPRLEYGSVADLCSDSDNTSLEIAILQRRLWNDWCSPSGASYLGCLVELAELLRLRFIYQSTLDDLNESVVLIRKALALGQCRSVAALNVLGLSLSARWLQQSVSEDLDEALILHEETIAIANAPGVLRAWSLGNLAGALLLLYNRDSQSSRIDTSLFHLREALCTRHLSPALQTQLMTTLGYALHLKHSFYSDDPIAHLQESLQVLRSAMDVCPSEYRHKDAVDTGLAVTLLSFYGTSYDPAIVEEVCIHYREALRRQSGRHTRRPRTLLRLSYCLNIRRLSVLGSKEDCNESIALSRQALDVLPPCHQEHAQALSSLARGLVERFNLEKAYISRPSIDLDEAVSLMRQHVQLVSESAHYRYRLLFNLATSLEIRYDHFCQQKDLDESISLSHSALALCPPEHTDHAFAVTVWGSRILKKRHLSVAEIDDAIMLHESLLQSPTHWNRRYMQSAVRNKAQLLHSRFLQSADPDDFSLSMQLFSQAAYDVSVDAVYQFGATGQWIKSAEESRSVKDALAAYRRAIDLVPAHLYLGNDISAQLQAMYSTISSLSCGAAGCALAASKPQDAVIFLERGRTVLWSFETQLRASFENLPNELQEDLSTTARDLRELRSRKASSTTSGEQDRVLRRTTHERFITLLGEARCAPGFRDFLLPIPFDKLIHVAERGPVVLLTSSEQYGASALLIRPACSTVEHLVLDSEIDSKGLLQLTAELNATHRHALDLVRRGRDVEGDERLMVKKKRKQGVSHAPEPLALLWRQVVQPVLQCLNLQKCETYGQRPRLWWCCSGPFSALPVHAAGVTEPTPTYTSDFVVSSYIPTLTSLISARASPGPMERASTEMLLIADPDVPELSPLPNALEEVNAIRTIMQGHDMLHKHGISMQIRQGRAAAMASMHGASVVHLACHGHQDPEDPLSSGFILRDGRLTISDIMQLQLPEAWFAFLSACESASGDRGQPDEAIHMAAAMMMAGFRSVIGTLWTMDDKDGPIVAKYVYPRLFKNNGEIDVDGVPFALDAAMRKLREDGVHWSRWATYIHIGI